ncbi:MAG: hypothetical protein JO214_18350 [Frankiaceae bacterium]|nr:hypothetical protein [Frankiaceae bacterium]
MRTMDKVALVGGAALAVATDLGSRKVTPESMVVPAAAVGLVTAAAIYPAARKGRDASRGVVLREAAALVGTGAVLAAAVAKRGSTTAKRTVAAGWLAHAIFDNVHNRGPTSRLPGWYPAACAGYDVALAGLVLRS